MRITILIPCHNEEKSIQSCVESCLNQTRKADEIIVVNDGSTDKSGEILASFGDAIKVVTIPVATGNKSHAQERGVKHVTGDVFIATDGDTLVDKDFVKVVEQEFLNPEVAAMGGAVKSLRHNWLTTCRAFEYFLGQDFHKLAQSYLNYMFVIPGAAGAFRTEIFRKHIKMDHDTITEDLDFTYKLHKRGLKIAYNRKAITYTQDPQKLGQYINQMRRWYGGGFQNLRKHFSIFFFPKSALELSLVYIEGIIFSTLLFLMPFINLKFSMYFFASYLVTLFLVSIIAAIREKRADILIIPLVYMPIVFINSYIFIEQFFKEIVLGRKNLVWFQPDRVKI